MRDSLVTKRKHWIASYEHGLWRWGCPGLILTTNIWAEYILQWTLILFFWDFKDTNAKMYYFMSPSDTVLFFFQYFVSSFRSDNFCCFIFKFTDFSFISLQRLKPFKAFFILVIVFSASLCISICFFFIFSISLQRLFICFKSICLYILEHVYNSCFKVCVW